MSGYLEVAEPGEYRFFVACPRAGTTVELRLDHLADPSVVGTAAADGAELARPARGCRHARVLYGFRLDAGSLGGGAAALSVQGKVLTRTPIPLAPAPAGAAAMPVTVYPATRVERIRRAHLLLSKTILLAGRLDLSQAELRHVLAHPADFSGLDLSRLAVEPTVDTAGTAALFGQLLRVLAYVRATDRPWWRTRGPARPGGTRAPSLPGHDAGRDLDGRRPRRRVRPAGPVHPAPAGGRSRTRRPASASPRPPPPTATANRSSCRLHRRTWHQAPVDGAHALRSTRRGTVGAGGCGQTRPRGRRPRGRCATRSGPATTWRAGAGWPARSSTSCGSAAGTRSWRLLHTRVRPGRAALRVLPLDPGTEPVVQTSRLRLAISAVQLFIQRCLLNLEPGVHPSAINAEHWEWMKRYRVWEANRKIFLWPENWLEPEFRDDKTHLFQALESACSQGDVTDDLAEDAFLGLPALAGDAGAAGHPRASTSRRRTTRRGNILHVVGRTFGAPHQYFYRTLRLRHVDAVGAGDRRDRGRPPGRGGVAGAPAPVLGHVPREGQPARPWTPMTDRGAGRTHRSDLVPPAADRACTCTGPSTTRASGPTRPPSGLRGV